MCITELDTFVKKFHQLWNDGVTAHLDLDTHAGDAWVGLRVRLGQVPGPLHYQVHPFHQEVPRKESPSRQRRRARRAAAKQANVEKATDTEAEEANEVAKETTSEQTVAVDAIVEHAANHVDQVSDEFCSNAEYENILSDENSECYRFVVTDTNSDIEVFKNKVRQSFLSTDVDLLNQHFEISGYEKLVNQSKFYLKIKNEKKAIEAIKNLKSETIFMRKIPIKKPNS